MPGPTPHYPPEFKREAVELYRSSERSIPKVAKDLGIADESLRRWIRQHEIDEGEREGLTTNERQELSRLRREVRVLKQDRCAHRLNPPLSSSRRRMGLGEFLQAHRGGEDELFYPTDVPDAGRLEERLLRLAWQATLEEEPRERRPRCQDPGDTPAQQGDLRIS